MAKDYQYAAPPIKDFVAEDYIVSNLSLGADTIPGTDEAGKPFDGTKYSVACKRFMVGEDSTVETIETEIKARFSTECSLQYALDSFLTGIMTRPNYKAHAKDEIEAEDFDKAHEMAQDLLDNYEVGRRKSVGPTMKAKVAQVGAAEKKAAELGISYDELLARAMAMQPTE